MATEQHPTIDQKLVISDLMDADLLKDLMGKFSAFAGLRIRLVDDRASIFIAQGDLPRICMLLKGNDQCRALCEEASAECGWMPLNDETPIIYNCYCGMMYAVVSLAAEFETLGRAIFGPFRSTETTLSKRIPESGTNRSQLEYALEKMPVRSREEITRISKLFADTMDIFLFLSTKRLLTSRLHLETIYRAREEIFKDMETQLRSKEDQDEIEKLKQIF